MQKPRFDDNGDIDDSSDSEDLYNNGQGYVHNHNNISTSTHTPRESSPIGTLIPSTSGVSTPSRQSRSRHSAQSTRATKTLTTNTRSKGERSTKRFID